MNQLLLFLVRIPSSRTLLCLFPCGIRTCCMFMDVRFVLLLICLPFCVCVQLQVHCGSTTAPGFCGPPHYSAPLECVPDVMGGLAVWRHDKPKTHVFVTDIDRIETQTQRHRNMETCTETATATLTASTHTKRHSESDRTRDKDSDFDSNRDTRYSMSFV